MQAKVNLIAFYTILRYEVTRFSRLWIQTFLPPVITMALYFIIFGGFIGSQINKIHGVSYMQFIAPGLIMMSIITNSYANVVTSFYGMRFQKCIDEILIAPVSNWIILLGFISGGILRGLIVGALVAIVALFFTHLYIHNIFITLIVAILTAALFSLAGFVNSIFARKFDDISIVPTFVLTPLTYLGGVFYSIQMLPHFWQEVSKVNPIIYIISSFRFGILGITDISVTKALGIILLAVIILFIINLQLLRKGIGIRT